MFPPHDIQSAYAPRCTSLAYDWTFVSSGREQTHVSHMHLRKGEAFQIEASNRKRETLRGVFPEKR